MNDKKDALTEAKDALTKAIEDFGAQASNAEWPDDKVVSNTRKIISWCIQKLEETDHMIVHACYNNTKTASKTEPPANKKALNGKKTSLTTIDK